MSLLFADCLENNEREFRRPRPSNLHPNESYTLRGDVPSRSNLRSYYAGQYFPSKIQADEWFTDEKLLPRPLSPRPFHESRTSVLYRMEGLSFKSIERVREEPIREFSNDQTEMEELEDFDSNGEDLNSTVHSRSSNGCSPLNFEASDDENADLDKDLETSPGDNQTSVLNKGDTVWYRQRDGQLASVQIVSVDHGLVPPSYVIRLNGNERETERSRLFVRKDTHPVDVSG